MKRIGLICFLLALAAQQLWAQTGVLVAVRFTLVGDQVHFDTGDFYRNGQFVPDSPPNISPAFVYGLSTATWSAISGRPMAFASNWPRATAEGFLRSAETYRVLGNDFAIVSAAPGGGGGSTGGGGTGTGGGGTVVRPPNDARSAAERLPAAGPTVMRSTINATREAGDPAFIAGTTTTATIWFAWTAPAAVRATVSTIGSSFDTVLGVYTAAGALVAENDDGNFSLSFTSSQVSFDATAGTQYQIAVDGFGGATGAVALNVGFVPRGAGPSSSSARLANIATRAQVGTGGNVLIPGIVITGSGQKTLLLRGVGPTLGVFGVGGALANPTITLLRGATTLAANDDWSLAANAAQVSATAAATGAFALPAGSRDAALLVTLDPGAYTLQMSGAGGGTGVGLVEVYDASPGGASGARLTNIATRAQVGTGADLLIPGFVVMGTGARKLLIRAIGPSLAPFGVAGTLRDPFLVLLSGATPIAANDDTALNGNLGEVLAAEAGVGAFPRQSGSFDAALLVTVPPGAYTVQVSGVAGGTGVALVEIYEAP